jgi:hypothetical protein
VLAAEVLQRVENVDHADIQDLVEIQGIHVADGRHQVGDLQVVALAATRLGDLHRLFAQDVAGGDQAEHAIVRRAHHQQADTARNHPRIGFDDRIVGPIITTLTRRKSVIASIAGEPAPTRLYPDVLRVTFLEIVCVRTLAIMGMSRSSNRFVVLRRKPLSISRRKPQGQAARLASSIRRFGIHFKHPEGNP